MRILSALVFLLLVTQVLRGQESFILEIHASGNIDFVLVDPSGRREGINPITRERFRGINNSYGIFSLDSEDPDINQPPSVIEFINSYSIAGSYSLSIFGHRSTTFSLEIVAAWKKKGHARFVIEGAIDSLQSVEYGMNIKSSSEASVQKVMTSNVLRQDLDNCYKLGLLEGEPLYTDLRHRVDKYESFLSRSDSVNAKRELEKLEKKLEEVWEKSKGPSRDPNHILKDMAYRILTGDVRALLK